MGASESKPANSPPPSPELDVPWRKMPWGKKDTLEEKLMNFKLYSPDVKFVRILVVGPVGVGKSSFINSINNAFQKRITCGALTANGATLSFTKTYKTHHIRGKDGSPLPFVFNDIMGLESENSGGARVEDIISALNGFLKEGYRFNPINPASKSDSSDKSDPSDSNQTLCLVNVISANEVSLMTLDFIQKMKLIREKASALHLPQIIIMTKVDEICPLVKKDIRKVYTSKKIKDKIYQCSNLLGVPLNHIFPVKNYHEEVDTVDDMDVLILKALDQIVHLANDALRDKTLATNMSEGFSLPNMCQASEKSKNVM